MRPQRWYSTPVKCHRCGWDITGYTPDEVDAHRIFDAHMQSAGKSIPSQPTRPDESNWRDRSRRETERNYPGRPIL